jgi:hypothetical protein
MVNRRLILIGVMLVVLSMVMASQYATTKVSYTFGIVHPSNADIRFVGSDNGSDGRVLRVVNNASGSQYITVNLGNWFPNSVKKYTAAFAIVNEEAFKVNITHCNVSGTAASYVTIYLHNNRSIDASTEVASAQYLLVSDGVSQSTANSNAWVLAAGNQDASNMNGTVIQTPWDSTQHVRYNSTTNIQAHNNTCDWVWVEISLNIPSNADTATVTGQIRFHFTASNHI